MLHQIKKTSQHLNDEKRGDYNLKDIAFTYHIPSIKENDRWWEGLLNDKY